MSVKWVMKCSNCEGTGEVRYRDIHLISSDIFPCQVCNGTGFIPLSAPKPEREGET